MIFFWFFYCYYGIIKWMGKKRLMVYMEKIKYFIRRLFKIFDRVRGKRGVDFNYVSEFLCEVC